MLHSKKTRVLGRSVPNRKSEKRLQFRDLRGTTLASKRYIAIVSCDFDVSLGARAVGVQVLCIRKTWGFASAL